MQAEGLTVSFGGQVVLDKASFSIQKKERCGLIGRNGAGKSTLFRILTGQESLDEGRVILPKGYRIGFLQQQIKFSQSTVLKEAALGLKIEEKDALYKVQTLLSGLGFSPEMMEASPHSLSGGYQLRVQLAKVLVSEPDCLLLDEPTNYLDIISIRFLTEFLQEWEGEMILISHDLQFLDSVTTNMMGIHRHKIYKIKGKSSDIFDLIAQEEKTHELTRQTLEKKKAHLQSFVDRFGAKASKATQAQSKQKMIDKLPVLEKLKNLVKLDFSFNQVPFSGKKMLEAAHLKFAYREDQKLIDDFSLLVEKGDRVAIIGKNGYGKSTILKLLTGEITPSQGETRLSPNLKIGYFGQTSIDRLDARLRIEEEIESANPTLNFSQIRSICGLMMFSGDLAKKSISVLSGGEKSRVLLGKIVAQPCNFLVLDEPTHHLDIESIESLIDAIESFEGATIVVTHSEWMLRRIAFNKLVVCHPNKQSLFMGSYDEFLNTVGWQEEGGVKKKGSSASKESGPVKKGKSLQSSIEKCEEKINLLENALGQHNEKLVELSELGKNQEIKELVKVVEEKQKELDHLYGQLSDLYNQTT